MVRLLVLPLIKRNRRDMRSTSSNVHNDATSVRMTMMTDHTVSKVVIAMIVVLMPPTVATTVSVLMVQDLVMVREDIQQLFLIPMIRLHILQSLVIASSIIL